MAPTSSGRKRLRLANFSGKLPSFAEIWRTARNSTPAQRPWIADLAHPTTQDDNDDYCSSCGGNGELICCDGCTRSFHFSCVDPVLMRDAMPVEWFCNVCRTNRYAAGPPSHEGSSFAHLLEKLDAKNSSAFRLPAPVRDRFEGVRTGADGEYEEITAVVKPTR